MNRTLSHQCKKINSGKKIPPPVRGAGSKWIDLCNKMDVGQSIDFVSKIDALYLQGSLYHSKQKDKLRILIRMIPNGNHKIYRCWKIEREHGSNEANS